MFEATSKSTRNHGSQSVRFYLCFFLLLLRHRHHFSTQSCSSSPESLKSLDDPLKRILRHVTSRQHFHVTKEEEEEEEEEIY
jgi:hypothetical protein